jgi:IclR family pca regulon transcriptional regulator
MDENAPKRRRAGPKPPAAAGAPPAQALDHWTGDPRFMQSLARGLLALSAVVKAEGQPVSPREISAATGLSVATARRCVYTLDAIGYLRANRNGAVPGPNLAALSADYAAASPLVAECGPILDRLHIELGVTVSLTTFVGDQPTIVASSTSEALLKLDLPVGASVPVHCSSAGKVYLASLSPEALARRLPLIDFKPYTEHTITSADQLELQLAQARRRGYAVADQELAIGVRSASAPIQNARGTVVASVNATMLAPAVGMRELKVRVVPALMRSAMELSRLAM